LVDVLIQHIFNEAVRQSQSAHRRVDASALALIAVGGFGRGELAPHSDIDLMFLKSEKAGQAVVDAIVKQVLYMLWDIGFKVGHATRTIPQSIEHANHDLKSKTALLESRLVAGDEPLYRRFQEQLTQKCFSKNPKKFIAARLSDQRDRHVREGGTVSLQEPNIKSGCGGLRDVQNMLWMTHVLYKAPTLAALETRALLTASERKSVEHAVNFLMRVRNELHYQTRRATETLSLSLQPKIATSLGYPQRHPLLRTEAFMRDYYLHARRIFLITTALTKRLAAECDLRPDGSPMKARLTEPFRTEKFEGFILKDGVLEADSPDIFQRDPTNLMRAFFHAQQRNADFGPDLRRLIRERLAAVGNEFRQAPAPAQIFLAILKHKGQVARILRLMHETDFLSKYLPEFGRLTCLVQHEFYHRYTADEHTLVALEKIDAIIDATAPPFVSYKKIFQQLESPHLLYLGLLLHDTGKALPTEAHAETSATLATRVAARLGLDAESTAALTLLVRRHLNMSQLSQRRDLDDRQTIVEMAKIAKTERMLDMLHLLTFADGQALGGGVWSDWKDSLLWELYEKTRDLIRGETAKHRLARRIETLYAEVSAALGKSMSLEEIYSHFELMPPSYFLRATGAEIVDHLRLVHRFLERQQEAEDLDVLKPTVEWKHFPDQGCSQVVVCTWDRAGLFANIAGSFAAAGLNILSANIYTRGDHIVLDAFEVCDLRLGAVTNPRSARVMQDTLERACTGKSVDFERFLAMAPTANVSAGLQESMIPTVVEIDNEASESRTVIEIQAEDRVGLLYTMCHTLTRVGLDITFAKISTEKGAAIDSFYVIAQEGGKITDANYLGFIRAELLKAIGGETKESLQQKMRFA
jgi:[protein-PII] uridylyltransferase